MNILPKIVSFVTTLILTTVAVSLSHSQTDETEPASSASYRQAMLSGSVIYAIKHKNKDLLSATLNAGFNPNMPFILSEPTDEDHNGYHALHFACSNDNHEAIEVLLKHKANPLIRNQTGKIAIYYAKEPACLNLLAGKKPAPDQDAAIEVLYVCQFPLGFLDFNSSPLLKQLNGKLPDSLQVRDIINMKTVAERGQTQNYIDLVSGEKGGIISLKLAPNKDQTAYDFSATWRGGPLHALSHEGTVVRWHGFWKASITKSSES